MSGFSNSCHVFLGALRICCCGVCGRPLRRARGIGGFRRGFSELGVCAVGMEWIMGHIYFN